MIECHLDLESYSEVDLTKIGVYKYAIDQSTDVLLASFAIGDEPVQRWRPGQPYPFRNLPQDQLVILAWNASFERVMWENVLCEVYGWPKLALEQFVCVAAQARCMAAAPGKLETAARFFRRPFQKDNRGYLHMLRMCRPATEKQRADYSESLGRDPAKYAANKRCHHTPDALDRLHDYCDIDVETERDIHRILPPWREEELQAYWENEYVNDHGVCVDKQFALTATKFAEEEKRYFNARLAELTANEVTSPKQFDRIKKWALARMPAEAIEMTEHYDAGVKKNTFDADTRANLLGAADADPELLTDDVYEFVDILDQAGKSTISKYEAIAARAVHDYNFDGQTRVHGTYVFAGAGQTGRASSNGIQVHNLLRNVPKDADAMLEAFMADDHKAIENYGPVVHSLAKLIRPTLVAPSRPGDYLLWGDWSAIEARVLPWLADDPRADARLDVFRRKEDIYLTAASAIYGREITAKDEDERQAGKVFELSCGFGGSYDAVRKMAKKIGVAMTDSQIKHGVDRWRTANQWAANRDPNRGPLGFWARLDIATVAAMRNPGVEFKVGRVAYRYDRDALGGLGALFCALPSGQNLCYPRAELRMQPTPWGEDRIGVSFAKGGWRPKKGDEANWPRVALYSGIACENVTQAAAACLLKLALRTAAYEPYRFDVCLHTHDELVIETRDPQRDGPLLTQLMTTTPPWPGGAKLPLAAETGYGRRYKVKA